MCEKCGPLVSNVTAEYGEEFRSYLDGLAAVVHLTCNNLLADGPGGLPGWISLCFLVGLEVGREHPMFAEKLVAGIRYGQQHTGNLDSARSAEVLEEALLSGLIKLEFGWKESDD